mgnify:FL=1
MRLVVLKAPKCVHVCQFGFVWAISYFWSGKLLDSKELIQEVSEVTEEEERHVAHIDEKLVEERQMDVTPVWEVHADPVALLDQRGGNDGDGEDQFHRGGTTSRV